MPDRQGMSTVITHYIVVVLNSPSHFNSSLTALRRANMDGIYDPHTNIMYYPKITQPTHAKWEEIPQEEEVPAKRRQLTNGVHDLTNGVDAVNLNHDTLFTPVPPIVARNYLVTDIVYQSPQISGLGVPGPDGDFHDVGPNGLANIPDELLAELPDDCRRAYEDAKAKEEEWRNTWRTEAEDGHRAHLKIGFSGVPV